MKLATTVLAIGFVLSTTVAYAQPVGQWAKVEALTLGNIVAVTDDSGRVVRGRLLRADAESLLLYAPLVKIRDLEPLEKLARDRPQILGRVGRVNLEVNEWDIRVELDRVTKKGVAIAALSDVFYEASRSNIVSVVKPQDQRGSIMATAAGAAAGFGAGVLSALVIVEGGEARDHIGLRTFASTAAFFGGPFLGGMVGNKLGRPKTDLVIYRR